MCFLAEFLYVVARLFLSKICENTVLSEIHNNCYVSLAKIYETCCFSYAKSFIIAHVAFTDIFENVMCLTECRHYSPIEVFGYRVAKQTLSKDFDERLCTHITDSS